MKICPQCGTENEKTAVFCARKGCLYFFLTVAPIGRTYPVGTEPLDSIITRHENHN